MMNNRSKLGRLALAGVAALALLLAACGGADGPAGGNGDEKRFDAEADSGGEQTDNYLADSGGLPGVPGTVNSLDSLGSAGGASNNNAPLDLERKITRTANFEVAVDNVLDSAQEVEDIAIAAGGFVSSSNLSRETDSEGGEIQTANIKVRVPAAAYTDVLKQFRALAKDVRSETSEAQEVTEEYTDLQSRLRNLEATERQYLELLGKAVSIPDILTVEDRLNVVRSEIEQVQGRINVLNDLTDLATISIRLVPPAVVAPAEEESPGWAQEAWETSWDASMDVLVVVGTIAIATVVFLPLIAVPAIIVLVAWRLFGRRIARWAENISGGTPQA
jgi:hypothetical protein